MRTGLLLLIPLGLSFVGLRYGFHSRHIAWEPYSAAGLDEHLRHGRTVLVNFRATWDPYCIYHEKVALDTPEVRRAVHSGHVVAMRADCTQESPEVMAALHSLGRHSVPVVAIYRGSLHEPIVLFDVTETNVLLALAASAER